MTGAPLTGLADAGHDLLAAERLDDARALDHVQTRRLDRREPAPALRALTTTTDAEPVVTRPRVDHAGIGMAAERAMHGGPRLRGEACLHGSAVRGQVPRLSASVTTASRTSASAARSYSITCCGRRKVAAEDPRRSAPAPRWAGHGCCRPGSRRGSPGCGVRRTRHRRGRRTRHPGSTGEARGVRVRRRCRTRSRPRGRRRGRRSIAVRRAPRRHPLRGAASARRAARSRPGPPQRGIRVRDEHRRGLLVVLRLADQVRRNQAGICGVVHDDLGRTRLESVPTTPPPRAWRRRRSCCPAR